MTQLLATAAVVAALSQPGTLPQIQDARPYHDLICSYDWSCEQAMSIAFCESSFNASAVGPGGRGLFQINPAVHAWRVGGNVAALFDAEVNTRVAHDLWLESGWAPWQFCRSR